MFMVNAPITFASKVDFSTFVAQVIRRFINDFDQGKGKLRVPKVLGLMRDIPGMPYHLTAELFLQITGITTFEFPKDKFDVYPGEICIVPAGMPHRERVRPDKGEPFLNLVFCYQGEFFHFHLAHEVEKGEPKGFSSSHHYGMDIQLLRGHIKTIVGWFHKKSIDWDLAIKSALLDHLFVILNTLENPSTCVESHKVVQMEAMVAYNLANPELSVEWIARNLQASPDYVTRLFRKTTGKSLKAYIIEQRLFHARHLLETSSSNISEISRAVGYDNPAYFTALFHRIYGVPPRSYRLDHSRS